ncbi:MAG: alpha/beta hydrolase [Actinomycetota bacterium]
MTSFETAQAAVLERCGLEATSQEAAVPSLGARAHVLSCGTGPPVVLVHGIGVPAAAWAPLMARLHGFRLHAVDLPGHGLSDAGAMASAELRDAAVGFLRDVLDGLGLRRTVLLGSSLGSLWALWFATARPDRVTALVHVGCPALAPGTSAPLPMRLLSTPIGPVLARIDGPSPAQVRRLARMVGEDPLDPEIADLLLETERRPELRPVFLSLLRRLLRLRGARPSAALTEEQLAAVAQPNLLVLGREDPTGGEVAGRRFVEALPDAELHLVDGGHAPWLRRADEVARIVSSFLYDRRSTTMAMP